MYKDNITLSKKSNNQKISTNFEIFREKIIKKAGKSKNLFKAHLFSFISINTFLVFLNIFTPGSYPWFLYPLGAMSMLLSIHYVSKNDRSRQKEFIEKYPVLTDKALSLLKKIFKKRRVLKLSTMFSVSVSTFLFMVNIITGPGYLWAAIPAAALASLSGTVWFFNKQNKKELIQEFRLRAAEKGIIENRIPNTNSMIIADKHPILVEAYSLKDSIFKQLKQIGLTDDLLINAIPEFVDKYILQIKTILGKTEEFKEILNSNSREKLLQEQAEISGKLDNTDNDQLITQYKASLKELDDHLTASKKITDQNELFTLKSKSALNSLKMLHLDLTNLNVEKMTHDEVLIILGKESNRLSERLEDLKKGYAEIELL